MFNEHYLGFSESDKSCQNPEKCLTEDSGYPGYQLLPDDKVVASVVDDCLYRQCV